MKINIDKDEGSVSEISNMKIFTTEMLLHTANINSCAKWTRILFTSQIYIYIFQHHKCS